MSSVHWLYDVTVARAPRPRLSSRSRTTRAHAATRKIAAGIASVIQINARIAYPCCPGVGAFEGRVSMLSLPRTPRQPGAADRVRACAPTTPPPERAPQDNAWAGCRPGAWPVALTSAAHLDGVALIWA